MNKYKKNISSLNKMNYFKNKKILYIGCHPDDVELGCGGLIHNLKNDTTAYILTLSKNKNNSSLIKEQQKSLLSLGIKNDNIISGDFKTREFSYSRQAICDFLWKVKNEIQPDCVFTTPNDLHQDHQVCNQETLRVFRNISIIEYNIIRSTNFTKPNLIISLSKDDVQAKKKALKQYKTYATKNYFSNTAIEANMKLNGIRFEVPICEVYNIVTMIL